MRLEKYVYAHFSHYTYLAKFIINVGTVYRCICLLYLSYEQNNFTQKDNELKNLYFYRICFLV